ncbi:MAG: LysE family translocator [Acidimicrobiia bacterium]|nr:LysE family translocator [Acidimicrobiia bacterium]
MPPLSNVLAFAAASMALIVVPGPSVLFVVSRGVALGRRAALTTVVGNTAGFSVHIVAVALGLGVLVERSATVFWILKLAGAGYLVYLGAQAVRRRRALAAVLDAATTPRSRRHLLREGFLVGIANPKAIVFLGAILPQFVEREAGPAGLQMLVLGGIFAVLALVCDSVWALAAGGARRAMAGSPEWLERMGLAGGVVMIALGARLAVAGRPE